MTTNSPSVAVVGGGLGGMATSVALTRLGFDVEVFEQAPAWGEVGAGINISSNATKALIGMGLGPQLEAVGDRLGGQSMRSLTTNELLSETILTGDPAVARRFTAPYYVFHRADLIGLLAEAAGPIHLEHRLASLEEHDDGATLEFTNGLRRRFDVVIAGDGIHSTIRRQLYGDDEPVYTGQTAWRAMIDGTEFPPDILGPLGFTGWMGKGAHIMVYHLRGGSLINMTGQADSATWTEEGWSIPADPDSMREVFTGANPILESLLARITTASKWGLFGRMPSNNWGRGRVQLIGDAAHPMLPNAGQGAGSSFEDAYILSRWLDAKRDDPTAALAAFRDIRIPRAHAVQRQTLMNTKLVHSGDWEARQAAFKARESTGDTPLGLGWIYDYEPAEEWDQRVVYPLSFDEEAVS
ncbi:MAG TPA: FAD-dependent monooxygenase [Pseudolysinimonas sp.]|nr:FAD-dependent monooxygenase [Pseudolysinimonas sp.]